MIVEQLTNSGVGTKKALYEPPFTELDGAGPDSLFSGKGEVVDGIFGVLDEVDPKVGSG